MTGERHIPWGMVLTGTLTRYFLFAGAAYLTFYILKRNRWLPYKIQDGFPKRSAVHTEIKYSVITGIVFSIVIYTFLFSPLEQYTRIYKNLHEHTWLYFLFSIAACIFIHDTYFYWTHRLMHLKALFPFVHHIHHKSHNPTPWAAYSFHPIEAVIEVGIVPVIVFLLPVHRSAIAIFGLYMIVMNVIGHLGYELYPKYFMRHKWLCWMNTSTHHNMHHRYSHCNYGLYFNLWDRVMNTNHKNYKQTFEAVKRKAPTRQQEQNATILQFLKHSANSLINKGWRSRA